MHQVVPPSFLFRWSFVAKRIDKIPVLSGPLLGLPDECELPAVGELDQKQSFAKVKLAWNNRGIGLTMSITGRSRRPECVGSELMFSDGIRIWIDTRNAQSVHRASKFCHHFVLLPAGGGAKRNSPIVRALPVSRAREDVPLPNSELVQVQSVISASAYLLEAWFPTELFVGFDPTTHQRIGFHYVIHDSEFGDQTLAVGNEFPVESDPSLWQTVELAS